MNHFFLMLSTLILLASCEAPKEVSLFTDRVMTMKYRILIGQKLSPADTARVLDVVRSTFDQVHRIYNNWNPDSEISRLNAMPANEEIPISPELMAFLKETDQLVQATLGYFDPTVGPLAKLWKVRARQGEVPSSEEIEQLRPAIGWDKLSFTPEGVVKHHPLTSLDLCAIAKGYCVDLLTEGLVQAGFSDVYVEWGGEIRAAGSHPEGRPWTVYISKLEDTDPNHAIDYISLKNNAVATSGDYLQSWPMNDGHVYTHIINPKTLHPIEVTSNNICSATVLADRCLTADALATAAIAFPTSGEAESWAKQLQEKEPSLHFWLVTRLAEALNSTSHQQAWSLRRIDVVQ